MIFDFFVLFFMNNCMNIVFECKIVDRLLIMLYIWLMNIS